MSFRRATKFSNPWFLMINLWTEHLIASKSMLKVIGYNEESGQMKILIPIVDFGRTGGYRVLSELANAWVNQGHDVDFLCLDSSEEPYFPTCANVIRIDGVGSCSNEVVEKKKKSRWHHLKALYCGLNLIGRNYDFVLANHSLTAWPVAFALCGNAKKIYYVQAYEPGYYAGTKKLKGYLFAIGSALTYHLSLNKIVNAPLYYRYMNLRASVFCPPGIDLAKFKPSAVTRNIGHAGTIVVGCIGRSEPEKGTVYVLRAFEELYKKDNRYFLKIAAYGKLPGGWTHQNSEVVTPENDNELADYYRSLDVLVAPGTVQHGAPHYPVLEAGACGIPVVTTGYMGATRETSWIVQNKDVRSIVDAIENIVTDNEQRNRKRAQFLSDICIYSWDHVSRQMIKHIENFK